MPLKKIIGDAITYDDVLLLPAKSSVLPRETNLRTRLTRHIELNIPLISAAMDTVTESEMAIAIAREGGIGILHKNMTIERQAEEVDRVKRSESGMIQNPITLSPHQTVGEALEVMRKYSISGIPIVEHENLVGILTNRDLRFQPVRRPSGQCLRLRGIPRRLSVEGGRDRHVARAAGPGHRACGDRDADDRTRGFGVVGNEARAAVAAVDVREVSMRRC